MQKDSESCLLYTSPQEQCVKALLAGIEVVADLSTQGYEMIGMGEMGIGNTTPSSALVSVLLNLSANEVTGRGAGPVSYTHLFRVRRC